MTQNAQLILVAGGQGTRLGNDTPKALVPLLDSPLFIHSLRAFEPIGLAQRAVVVFPDGHEMAFRSAIDAAFPDSEIELVVGGAERYDSVKRGLQALSSSTEIVLIHDAARPFIPEDVIRAAMDVADSDGAATVATRCKDTILKVDDNLNLIATPDRRRLWACQTPQVFRRAIIESAYAGTIPEILTDDATLVRQSGHAVQIVEGPDTNIKITTPLDMELAAHLLNKGST